MEDQSLVKLPSTFMPKRAIHKELENILQPVERLVVNVVTTKDNIQNKRSDLESLIQKTESREIVIKPADKGDMIVIQSGQGYRDMCMDHLGDTNYYTNLRAKNPERLVKEKVIICK